MGMNIGMDRGMEKLWNGGGGGMEMGMVGGWIREVVFGPFFLH
jgi:hypothetical protein